MAQIPTLWRPGHMQPAPLILCACDAEAWPAGADVPPISAQYGVLEHLIASCALLWPGTFPGLGYPS